MSSQLPVSKKDGLELLIEVAKSKYESAEYWTDFVSKYQEFHRGLHPDVKHLPHRAARLLDRLRSQGFPVVTKMASWPLKENLEALKQGPHQSPREHVDFFVVNLLT
jgi:hypothetical protein